MPRWEIRAAERITQKDAPNWLVALGLAVEELALDAEAFSRMICDHRNDGLMVIREPIAGLNLTLRRLTGSSVRPAREAGRWDPSAGQVEDIFELDFGGEEQPAPKPRGPARFALADSTDDDDTLPSQHSGNAASAADFDELFDDWGDGGDSLPPPVNMPAPRMGHDSSGIDADALFGTTNPGSADMQLPQHVALALLERGVEIANAPREVDAANLALTVLRQVVPAESGSVLVIGTNGLGFLAVQGPRASELRGASLPLGLGIAGFAVANGKSLIVHNARADIRFFGGMDVRSGYRTQAILAVPLRDARDTLHGCIELLNPPSRFLPWHLEAAQTVAVALAERLRSRGG